MKGVNEYKKKTDNISNYKIVFFLFLCSFFLIMTVPGLSMALTIPDTGQTGSYTAIFGEDSDYTISPPSYTNNGNGTITDNVTNLMWQQNDDGEQKTWYQADNYCNSLTLGNKSDWRLPSFKELQNIKHYNYDPRIHPSYFPSIKPFSAYWSSTNLAGDTTRAWLTPFNTNSDTQISKNGIAHVLCVRGTQDPNPDFTNNNDGTVTDNNTNLMWQREDNNSRVPWEQAIMYCENLVLEDYSDWRLANVKELFSIVDNTRWGPAIDSTYFPGTEITGAYWSSTANASDARYAWAVHFNPGQVNALTSKTLDTAWIRCVRGESLIDNDGDGYSPDTDCDDFNPNVNPGATEVCNGIDDNCLNGIDETGNALCDDGLYCNGAEICGGVGGCRAGTPPSCDNGFYCDGVETCNETTDSCNSGTPIDCNDGVSCTIDTCDENIDLCVYLADDTICNDEDICNGEETCDAVNDCQAGIPPDSDETEQPTVMITVLLIPTKPSQGFVAVE
jgi:hypothetical protein